MKILTEKQTKVLESLDWTIIGYDGKNVEIENFSPAGEDLVLTFCADNFNECVAEYANEFDVDEHIEMWIEAKHNGDLSVPSIRRLVHDAEDIADMLEELAMKLYK